jgi:mannan endo-1,4-beta-mannosidase
MKKTVLTVLIIFLLLTVIWFISPRKEGCLTGAFLADKPKAEDILKFNSVFGKKPYLVMVFTDWGNFVDEDILNGIYEKGCALFVTWEPWNAYTKESIDYDALLKGSYDKYISDFALSLKKKGKIFFIRFGHEVNGDWYPWSGRKIGKDKYIAICRYVKGIFDKNQIDNARWVFSVNWEDVPEEKNYFLDYYPGDDYVDFIGIDGYNWGNTRSWSRWMSFRDIFDKRIKDIRANLSKEIIISEFSSASKGGDKLIWIKKALDYIKSEKAIRGFVLFNIDKEEDWSFYGNGSFERAIRKKLADGYFLGHSLSRD